MPSLNQTRRIPIRVTVDNGAANYFAGAQTVLDYSGEQAHIYSADIDVNGFTNGALLTATVAIKVGSTIVARQYQTQMTKDASNTIFRVIDGDVLVVANANAILVSLQSNNALDIAVAVPISYFAETS